MVTSKVIDEVKALMAEQAGAVLEGVVWRHKGQLYRLVTGKFEQYNESTLKWEPLR